MATYIGNFNHIVDFDQLLANLRSEDDYSFRMNQPLRDAEYIWDEEKLKTVAPHRQKFLNIKFTVED